MLFSWMISCFGKIAIPYRVFFPLECQFESAQGMIPGTEIVVAGTYNIILWSLKKIRAKHTSYHTSDTQLQSNGVNDSLCEYTQAAFCISYTLGITNSVTATIWCSSGMVKFTFPFPFLSQNLPDSFKLPKVCSGMSEDNFVSWRAGICVQWPISVIA